MEHLDLGPVSDMLLQWKLLFSLLVPVITQDLNIQNYRLPLFIDSVTYNISLDPNLDTLTFDGHLLFTFRTLKNVPVLILNSKNLLVDTLQLFAQDELGNAVKIAQLVEDTDLERLTLTPIEPFVKGRQYSVNLKYQGNITENGVGLYRSSYIDNGTKEWMLVSQMRPVHARTVFPCLDEPSFRARFSLSVWHNKDYYAVSNMPPLYSDIYGNRALTVFEQSPTIPVFLTGLLISKLGIVSGERGFTSLAIPEEVPGVVYSAEIGPKLATAMEGLIAIRYPQQKTHQVALPRLIPVAMENWGLFNFKRENILYNPGISPTVQKQTVARFSGHEVAHAWLGNSVTIAWWDYLWLSEMFAMYLEYYLPHLVEPSWRMDEQLAVDLSYSGLQADSPAAEPLTTKVLTPTQISAKFSGLTYTKGPGLLRMVQYILTLPNFFNGIKRYLEVYWEKSVTPRELWQCLEEEGAFPTSLEHIMAGWTDQPGYPVVSVTHEDGLIVARQKPFSIDNKDAVNSSWWIPISLLSAEDRYVNTRTSFWLPPGKEFSIPATPNWLLLNVDGSGFFRTSYQPELLNRIIGQLETDHTRIPPLSRALLVDDAVWLARAGLQDVQDSLKLISYLSSELDFIVWKSAATTLQSLASLLLHSKIYPLYKSYALHLLNNIYNIKGLNESPHDSHIDKVQREIVVSLACRMGHPDCSQAAVDHTNALMSGRNQRISPDVKASIFCTAVSYGGNEAWEFFLSLYNNQPEGNAQYLESLACTTDQAKMEFFLIDSISEINEEQWLKRFSAFSSRKENANTLLKLLHQNINIIVNKYGMKSLNTGLLQFTKYLTTTRQSDLLQDIQRLGAGGLSAEILQVRNRAAWLDKNIPAILSYFKVNFHFGLITT